MIFLVEFLFFYKKKEILQEISLSEKDPFFTFTFKPLPPGLYEIVFSEESINQQGTQESYRIPIWVTPKKTEKESVLSGYNVKKTKITSAVLKIQSMRTDTLNLVNDNKKPSHRFEVIHSNDSRVWENIYFLSAFFLLATIAWIIRKRWLYD